jgi:quercetin dioxygenase-like cupin family protein
MKYAAIGALVIAGCTSARAQAPSPSPELSGGFILGPEEGDRILSHVIKVDPARGSQRLGMGRQHISAARSIALHIHDGEDELLYAVSGRAIGVVGSVEREVVAGSVIYVPQGAWHGLKAIKPTEILWIVSPPNFARSLREVQDAGGQSLPESRREEIARKHQQSDSRTFLRLVLANSEWLGDERWGQVAFGADGLTATYRTPSGRAGVIEIRDERREDLGFTGVWRSDDENQGEFVLTYEFASGSTIYLNSSQGVERRSTLRRTR